MPEPLDLSHKDFRDGAMVAGLLLAEAWRRADAMPERIIVSGWFAGASFILGAEMPSRETYSRAWGIAELAGMDLDEVAAAAEWFMRAVVGLIDDQAEHPNA